MKVLIQHWNTGAGPSSLLLQAVHPAASVPPAESARSGLGWYYNIYLKSKGRKQRQNHHEMLQRRQNEGKHTPKQNRGWEETLCTVGMENCSQVLTCCSYSCHSALAIMFWNSFVLFGNSKKVQTSISWIYVPGNAKPLLHISVVIFDAEGVLGKGCGISKALLLREIQGASSPFLCVVAELMMWCPILSWNCSFSPAWVCASERA